MTSHLRRPAALVLFTAAAGLIAQDGNWTYEPLADKMTDSRTDSLWTPAVFPAASAYRIGVVCDDTEFVSVFVRSDSALIPAATIRARFDGGGYETLAVEPSLASPNRYSFEPAGNALRRMLASKTMIVTLQNKDREEVPVQFEVAGFETAVKQMPSKCQVRFAERVSEGSPATKPAARSSAKHQ